MVFVSATRLRLRSPLYLPAFGWHMLFITRQTINAPGFLGGKLLTDANRVFWTLTVWEEQSAMKIYRNSSAHRKAMPKIQDWCDEAAVVHWVQEETNIPDWIEVYRRMVADGFPTKLSKPSPSHIERNIPQPVSSKGLPLHPNRKNANLVKEP